jgi:D-sedoheptulose 7-phosphate isomerase
LGAAGDALIAISTSGNSDNLLHAFQTARRMNLKTIGFAGDDGGRMQEMSANGLIDYCFTVSTSSIHRIQESHVTLYHIVWDMVHEFLQHPALLTELAAHSESAADKRGSAPINQTELT